MKVAELEPGQRFIIAGQGPEVLMVVALDINIAVGLSQQDQNKQTVLRGNTVWLMDPTTDVEVLP